MSALKFCAHTSVCRQLVYIDPTTLFLPGKLYPDLMKDIIGCGDNVEFELSEDGTGYYIKLKETQKKFSRTIMSFSKCLCDLGVENEILSEDEIAVLLPAATPEMPSSVHPAAGLKQVGFKAYTLIKRDEKVYIKLKI